jgi:DNA-binding MarR family transcriptional regulator
MCKPGRQRSLAQDSRRAVLTLTGDGRRLYRRSVRFRLDHLESLLGDWTPVDRATFARLLGRFAATANA